MFDFRAGQKVRVVKSMKGPISRFVSNGVAQESLEYRPDLINCEATVLKVFYVYDNTKPRDWRIMSANVWLKLADGREFVVSSHDLRLAEEDNE